MVIPRQALRQNDGLLIVDVQIDFCPGGALPIDRGDEVVPVLNQWVAAAVDSGAPVVAPQRRGAVDVPATSLTNAQFLAFGVPVESWQAEMAAPAPTEKTGHGPPGPRARGRGRTRGSSGARQGRAGVVISRPSW